MSLPSNVTPPKNVTSKTHPSTGSIALLALTLLLTPCLIAQTAPYIDTSSFAPHRYLVVYRNATIPGDAESHARLAGTNLLQRNERFGIATVQSADPTRDDATTIRLLAAQPNVAYVLHDRIIAAESLVTKSVTTTPPPTGQQPVGKLPTHGAIHIPTSAPISAPPPPAPFDTFYSTPQAWAVQQVGGYGNNVPGGPAHGPWDITMGKGVRIAILDSGVDAAHPDIAPNLALNLTEVNQDPQTGYPSPCDDGTPQDQEGHGTWTASLAAAAAGPGTGQVIGVAPAATILNIKVLQRMPVSGSTGTTTSQFCEAGQASGLLSWTIQGIEDAIANRADVISLSVGVTADLSTGEGAGLKAAFDQITYAANQAGIVLIAAAGNDGLDLSNPRYVELPAQSRGVLAIVASTNPACAQNTTTGATCAPGPITLAYYSNYGAPLNALAAPGGSYPDGGDQTVSGWVRGACSSGIPSTTDGLPSDSAHSFGCFNLGHTQYVQAMGTSASAPLAAGVTALIRAAHPDWDPDRVIAAMRSSAITTPALTIPQVNAATTLTQP